MGNLKRPSSAEVHLPNLIFTPTASILTTNKPVRVLRSILKNKLRHISKKLSMKDHCNFDFHILLCSFLLVVPGLDKKVTLSFLAPLLRISIVSLGNRALIETCTFDWSSIYMTESYCFLSMIFLRYLSTFKKIWFIIFLSWGFRLQKFLTPENLMH